MTPAAPDIPSSRRAPSAGVSRRSFLSVALGGAAGLALVACTPPARPIPSASPTPPAPPSPSPSATVRAAGGSLRIPPLLPGEMVDGRRVFELSAQPGTSAITAAGVADTWGYNGAMLGPTIRMRRGETVQMRVQNALPEMTTVHWHGMHLPAAADGTPHQPIGPGQSWTPSWTVDQPAATLWYHPHPHGSTEAHVYRGLAGMLIVDDDDDYSLPSDYGVDDIPLIVQDKTFDSSGRLVEVERSGVGMLGDTILVNGTVDATFVAAAEATRFRILNGSTARSYSLGFDDGREFELVASDGGLLGAPVPLTRLLLTPGERAEIVVRFASGSAANLRSYPQDLGNVVGRTGAGDEFQLLAISAPPDVTPSSPIPREFAPLAAVTADPRATERRFLLRFDRINDAPMDMNRIDEVVTVDRPEIWTVENVANFPHNFHVHGLQFRVLDIDGAPPPAELSGWKDTLYLPPRRPARLALTFANYSDPAVPYMYHCHLLWHEDGGVMGQLVVVEPGQQPAALESHDH